MRFHRLLTTGVCLSLLVACGDTGDSFVHGATTTSASGGSGTTSNGGAGGTGGSASGGAGGTGGSASGGAGGTGGSASATGGAGGSGGSAGCPEDEKLCGEVCVNIDDPTFGCAPSGLELPRFRGHS